MTVNILGTSYTINKYGYKDKPDFEKRGIDGYCDSIDKEIAYVDMKTYPGFENEIDTYCKLSEKQTIRHEIIHAFFNESGLRDSANHFAGAWCKNEEMVDWISLQFPKIVEAFREVDAL